MGYESRLYIMEVNDRRKSTHASFIARVDMAKVGSENGFYKLFDGELRYTIYSEDGNTELTKDLYGERPTVAPLERVIEWLENEMKTSTYRRFKPLYELLKALNTEQWGNIEVVHFGY